MTPRSTLPAGTTPPAPSSTRRTVQPSLATRAKALRLIAQSRVAVVEVDAGRSRVEVVGDSDVYDVIVGASGVACPCACRRGMCSHAIAAELVTRSARR